MIISLLLAHSMVSLVFFLAALVFYSMHHALGALAGAILMGANLVLLVWTWGQIIQKKSVALAVGVIVFKYAILILLIIQLVGKELVHPISFFFGLLSLLPTLGWLAFREHERLKTYG